MRSLVLLLSLLPLELSAEESLRLLERRESLTGTHLRYLSLVEGLEVVGEDVIVELDPAGRRRAVLQRSLPLRTKPFAHEDRSIAERAFQSSHPGLAVERVEPVAVVQHSELREAWRIVARATPLQRYEYVLDARSLQPLRVTPLFFNAVQARLFAANPVTVLNDPALHDLDNSAAAVPDSAYSIADLLEVSPTGPLAGPFVSIVDLEAPKTQPADPGQPLNHNRSDQGFEDVMAYHHLDRSQRYLQSLGYNGPRQIITRSIQVDSHGAGGQDNSYYAVNSRGEGVLAFGDGGVDDAEDPDILLHEYGHAIHEAVAPGAFMVGGFGSQARAMGEGFGDYWAFSGGYSASLFSGRDEFCLGDWDARCASGPSTGCTYPAGANCLRRVDGVKTMDDYIQGDGRGNEHRNGEIWSSALREIFLAFVQNDGVEEGRRNADRLMVESIFGMPPTPTFQTGARKLLQADQLLYRGSNFQAICAAMISRKILGAAECNATPRGDFTLYPASGDGIIPDNQANGVTFTRFVSDDRLIDQIKVRVEITHSFRGDVRLVLTAPNGLSAVLHARSNDPGEDLRTTFGLDSQSVDSLDVFRGLSARGEWKLHVSDLSPQDVGRLDSWALLIRFQGDAPLTIRPAATPDRLHLTAVAHTPGAAGTNFVSDVRLFNRGSREARVTMFFTSSGRDGTTEFAALPLSIASGQIVALDDVVAAHFRDMGIGNLEFRGDTSELQISSRTYNQSADGTYGQFIPARGTGDAAGAGEPPVHLTQLRNDEDFRTNIGFTEVHGAAGTVELNIRDASNQLLSTGAFFIAPYSHLQIPILGGIGGVSAEIARAELHVSGGARILAYASVVDNESGDAIYIPAGRLERETRIIPAALHADGANGTRWRTDLALTNVGDIAETISLTYRPAAGGSAATVPREVPAFSSVFLPDVLGEQFGIGSGGGQLEVSESSLLTTSRTWTDGLMGSFGQFIGSRGAAESIGAGSSLVNALQLINDSRFRTNVGAAEITGAQTIVRMRLFDASGTELLSTDRVVPPHGQIQFNLSQAGAPEFQNGRVSFEVLSGSGRIFGYASVVDNRSSDPIYVPAQ